MNFVINTFIQRRRRWGACAPQVLGYQFTLFGPRGADYARHITTGPPIFLDDAAPLHIILAIIMSQKI